MASHQCFEYFWLIWWSGNLRIKKIVSVQKIALILDSETIQVLICTRNIENWRDKTNNLSFIESTSIKSHKLETLLWMGRHAHMMCEGHIWFNLISSNTSHARVLQLPKFVQCKTPLVLRYGCYSVHFLGLHLLLIKFAFSDDCCISKSRMKRHQKSDWKSDLRWLDYG